MSDSNHADKREELISRAKDHRQELQKDQEEILQDIQSEHGGDLIRTPVSITSNHTATVEAKINGQLINRMAAVESSMDSGSMRSIEQVMDEASDILASLVEESEYDKALFYGVYDREGPDALAAIVEKVFDAIETERERQAGAVEGFRKSPGDSS